MRFWLITACFYLLVVILNAEDSLLTTEDSSLTTEDSPVTTNDQIRECQSDNSLEKLTTFKNRELGKTGLKPNVYYTLMTDRDNEISVHVKYEPCTSNEAGLCNCAVYVKVGNDTLLESKYALIDFCDANPAINSHLRFYSTTKTVIDATTLSLSSSLPTIDCDNEIEDPADPEQWSAINFYQGVFKCAKFVEPESNCQTSYLQASYYSKSALLKLDTKCKKVSEDEIEDESEEYEYLTNVMIVPPKEIAYVTGGLCGNMVENLCHLFDVSLASLNGTSKCVNSSSALGAYWTSTARQKMHLRETFSRPTSEFECMSFNYDTSLKTFSSSMLKDKNFKMDKSFENSFILYEHNLHTMVNVKYNLCSMPYKNAKFCTCAAYVRLNRTSTTHFAFIDVCKIESYDIEIETFSHYTDKTVSDLLMYERFNCSSIIEDENDEKEWERVPTSFEHFKCATLKDNTCASLVLKTIGADYSNIKVKVDAHCKGLSVLDPISQVVVNPSVRSEVKSNGLCGKWVQREQLDANTDEEITTESTLNTLEWTSRYNLHAYENSSLIERNVNNAIVPVNRPKRSDIINFNKRCKSVDDPYIYTFGAKDKDMWTFRETGQHTFYSFNERIRVITGFVPCCNCAVFITVDPGNPRTERTVYKDFCAGNLAIRDQFENEPKLLDDGTIKDYCYQKDGDPLTEEIWNDWPEDQKPLLGVFKCIKNRMTGVIYIRVFRDPKNQKFETLVVLYPGSAYNLYTIKVFPSFESAGKTSGLCGSNGRSCDLMYRDHHNNAKCAMNGSRSALQEFSQYWRVKPKVVARNLRGADPQFKANEEKRLRKIEETQSRIHPRFLQKFDQEDARLNCESAIKKVVVMTDDPQIDEQLEKITEDKIQVCTLDLTRTGDSSWSKVHADAMKIEIMKFIMEKREFFDENMVIKDETLTKFKISCPRNCVSARNGKCVKNMKCRFDTGCDYMVKCECNSPYSSSDCSVNINQPPEFWLAQKCCDARTMDCDTISLIGDFSDTEEITVKLESEMDSSTFVSFIATLTDKNRTDFKFPYGKFPGIKESHHRIRVGVSYGKSDPSTQVIDFYDSRCRTCDDKTGVSEEPIEGKCISKSGVCSSYVAGVMAAGLDNTGGSVCWEPRPCNSVFDVGLIVHSSDAADEQNFEMIKNSMAEMLGRFDLGRDKVHAGMMYYGRRIVKSTTVARKDQLDKKLTTDRAQSIPYVPIPSSPVSQALKYAHDVVFTKSRANSDTFPRVAVLLNYQSGSDGNANPNANLLKSKNIELMTIGIGDQVSPSALNELASISPVLVHGNQGPVIEMKKNSFVFKNPSDIFKNLPELVERVCSMSAKARMNVPSRIEFSERFAMNYFQIDVVPDSSSSTLLIEINTLQGYSQLYCSYMNPNPSVAEGCAGVRRQTREGETSYLFLDLPSSPRTLYFAIESFERKGDFTITFSQY